MSVPAAAAPSVAYTAGGSAGAAVTPPGAIAAAAAASPPAPRRRMHGRAAWESHMFVVVSFLTPGWSSSEADVDHDR